MTAVSQCCDRGDKVRLSSLAGEHRRTDGWRRQAARETIKGCCRQDRDDRAGAGKFLQGFDLGFRKPNAASGSPIGRAPDVNEDTRAAPRDAIARIVDKETAAVERTAAHVVGLRRTDVRALRDRIVKRRGGILHADRLPGLELDVARPPRRSKTEARSDTEEACRCPVVAFKLLRFLVLLEVEEGVTPAKAGFADDGRLGRADAFPR